MDEDAELELLLALDGKSYEAAAGYVAEFMVRRTQKSAARPKGGKPYVRFDNAHAVPRAGGRFVRGPQAHDHWHRTETDPGRPYTFTSAMQLLDDFWREVKRVLAEKDIPNDL
jgi:hypothetical protein